MQENNITTAHINTNGKMKLCGYILIGFALLFTILAILQVGNIKPDESTIELIKFWAYLGVSLLFGNAGKHLVGNSILQKQSKGVQ